MSRLTRIFPGSKYLILSSIAERIFFFLIFLIIDGNFAVIKYGEIITVFAVVNIFIIFFDSGLPVLLQKEVSLYGKKASGFLSNILLICLISFPLYILSVHLILIQEYGIKAAAAVTVVTEYYIFITGYLLISKHIKTN